MSARLVPSQLSGAAVIFFQVAVGGSGFSGVGGTGISGESSDQACDRGTKQSRNSIPTRKRWIRFMVSLFIRGKRIRRSTVLRKFRKP